MAEYLEGGRYNIIKDHDIVFRPSHEWTSNVQEFLGYLVSFMRQEADNGDEAFAQYIDDGHLKGYLKDMEYIREQWTNF